MISFDLSYFIIFCYILSYHFLSADSLSSMLQVVAQSWGGVRSHFQEPSAVSHGKLCIECPVDLKPRGPSPGHSLGAAPAGGGGPSPEMGQLRLIKTLTHLFTLSSTTSLSALMGQKLAFCLVFHGLKEVFQKQTFFCSWASHGPRKYFDEEDVAKASKTW